MSLHGKNHNSGSSGQDDRIPPVILGFDPGIQISGWGAIRAGKPTILLGCGKISTPQKKPVEVRLNIIYSKAMELIEQYKPSVVAVEDPFLGKSVSSALILGQARGVLLLAGARSGVEVAHYPPRLIKSSIVGRGAASKEQVQFMVQRLLGLREPPDSFDASDALAVALCHLHRQKLDRLKTL